MNKTELVAKLGARVGLSKEQAGKVLDAITEEISNELARGGKVVIQNFGTFDTRTRRPRRGVFPGTTDRVTYPAKTFVRFSPGKGISEFLTAKP